MSSLVQLQGPACAKFYGAIRSPFTKRVYHRCLSEYIAFLHTRGLIPSKSTDCLLVKDTELIEQWIISWIAYQKEQGLSVSIMHVRKSALKLFYDVNKIQGIAWKIISKNMGENRKLRDRPYSRKEIQSILEKADFRTRVVILLLASTGMRIGAIAELKWRNLEKIENLNIVYVDTSDIVAFKVPKKNLDGWIRLRVHRLEDARAMFEVPDGETSGLCKYCRYQTRCSATGKGLAGNPLSVPKEEYPKSAEPSLAGATAH